MSEPFPQLGQRALGRSGGPAKWLRSVPLDGRTIFLLGDLSDPSKLVMTVIAKISCQKGTYCAVLADLRA